jgi:hypothetical protein
MAVTLNASTSTGYIQTADTSGDLALQSNGTTQFNVTSTGAYGQLKSGTAVTASGTSVDFTSIPSWVKRITVVFNGVSTNGTSNLLLQLGDSGGIENTGYTSRSQTTGASATSTAGFILTVSLSTSADTFNGAVFLNFLSANTWTESAIINHTGQNVLPYSAGSKTLSDTLDRVRITTVNGTDTFDAGTINILYEG